MFRGAPHSTPNPPKRSRYWGDPSLLPQTLGTHENLGGEGALTLLQETPSISRTPPNIPRGTQAPWGTPFNSQRSPNIGEGGGGDTFCPPTQEWPF